MYPVTKGKSNEKIQGAIFYAPSLPLPPEGGGAAAWTNRGTPAILFSPSLPYAALSVKFSFAERARLTCVRAPGL